MKKLIIVFFTSLLLTVCPHLVSAEEDHIYQNENGFYLTEEEYRELNDDLRYIEDNYDIGIYVAIGALTNEMDQVAHDVMNGTDYQPEKVVLVTDEEGRYVLLAQGEAANEIYAAENDLWMKYALGNTYHDGVKDFYQACVKIINAKVYHPVVPQVSSSVKVYDNASLLSDSEQKELQERLTEISRKQGMDVVLVTADSTDGAWIDDYANDFYDYNGYKDDGVLLLIVMEDRSWYVSTKGKGSDYFTDYGIDYIFEQMSDDLADGKFFKAFSTFADEAEYFIEEGKKGDIIDNNNKPTEKKHFGFLNVGISSIAAAISSLIGSLIMRGQMKSVHKERYAGSYLVDNSVILTGHSDHMIDRRITRHYNPPVKHDSGSSSSGGGSTIHTSSSGSSHGGHGGHF